MVIGNFERALVGFKDQRRVTEGVIHLNALICIVILLTADRLLVPDSRQSEGASTGPWGRLVAMGAGAALIAVLVDWAIVARGLYGDRFADHAGLSIRFGPNATTWGSGALSSSESELERPSPQGKRAPRIGTEVHLLSCIR